MAITRAEMVKETTTTTGTGTYDLAGAATGFRTFVDGIGSTNTCRYMCTDGTDWEVGEGVVTDLATDTLTRATIIASSNAGSAVNWGAGSKDIACVLTAEEMDNPHIDGAITETVYPWATTTGSNTTDLDDANGSIHTVTLTGNITALTDNITAGTAITLMIDDGTAYTITWPTMTWVNNGGTAPTLATTGYTVVTLWKVSTTLYGALVGDGT